MLCRPLAFWPLGRRGIRAPLGRHTRRSAPARDRQLESCRDGLRGTHALDFGKLLDGWPLRRHRRTVVDVSKMATGASPGVRSEYQQGATRWSETNEKPVRRSCASQRVALPSVTCYKYVFLCSVEVRTFRCLNVSRILTLVSKADVFPRTRKDPLATALHACIASLILMITLKQRVSCKPFKLATYLLNVSN